MREPAGTEHSSVFLYLARVRKGLRGLPAADVDDTIEEMRTHLLEEIGERGSAEAVLADFGDAAEVASRIVRDRLCPEDGQAVPEASIGRRYSAWATDVVVGFGPLVLIPSVITLIALVPGNFAAVESFMPIWILLVGWALEHWVMSPAELGMVGSRTLAIPAWQWLLLVALVAWAAYYWLVLRRRDSRSLGMWMTGLRVVRVDDERLVVRERDISQRPMPLGAGRGRWWVLVGAIPMGCLCTVLALYYFTFAVGSLVQPWDALGTSFQARADGERQRDLCNEFTDYIAADEREAALGLCDGPARAEVEALLDLAGKPDFKDFGYVDADEAGTHRVFAYTDDGQQRTVWLRISTTERVDGGDYTTSYRIEGIEIGPKTAVSDTPVE